MSVSSHPKGLVHSTLMKDASFAPRRNLKHGVLLIGRLLNISWETSCFSMIHLVIYFRICCFCVIYQISAVQMWSCLSNFYFHCLPEENIFKDPATWYFFRMFNSNASLTSEYCKQAQWPGLPKLRWSTGVAEFWSGEWNLKVQDMKRDENQSDNLRHLKTVCLDGLPLNRLLLCCFWGLPSQSSGPQDKTNYIFTERFSFSSGFACFNPCIVLEKSDE